MKFKILPILLLSAFTLHLWAAIPSGYYDDADAKNSNQLRLALSTIVSTNTSVTSYSGLWTSFATTDIYPATGNIWDMYSNCSFVYGQKQCGSYSGECSCYNREHTTPQSWFSSASPMYSDLFNVYPTDGYINGMRSNYPYGEVNNSSKTSGNGSKLGNSSFSGYSGTVFEPIDEYKGDLARTVMFMATRYADKLSTWISQNSSNTDVEVVYDVANGLTPYAIDLFLSWSRNDPVSTKETNRNDAVYAIQSNRNPFIDYPGLEEYIWGNKTNALFYVGNVSNPTDTPTINVPGKVIESGQDIAFGTVAGLAQKSFVIKTADLTGDLTVSVVGEGFDVSTTTILQSEAEAGYTLSIYFNPSAAGDYNGNVTITGGGLVANFVFNLSGTKL